MRKTLSKKIIKGKEYFYLSYRKKGKLVSEYLGSSSSTKFKKYLYSLLKEPISLGYEKAKIENFKNGFPVCYVEDGYLVYEYKNGSSEWMNGLFEILKVKNGKEN